MDHNPVEPGYKLTNRQQAQEPRGGLFWCPTCDRCLVGDVRKCRRCGFRNGKPNRMKKPGPLGTV